MERCKQEEYEAWLEGQKTLRSDGIKYKGYRILMLGDENNLNYIVTLTVSLWDKAPLKGSTQYTSVEEAKRYIDGIT